MDYLQYPTLLIKSLILPFSFKPYYKWITFNTQTVLNHCNSPQSFKPYYKWITFNTLSMQQIII